MEKQIWCLFSVVCDYNQQKNNLEGWFSNKPNIDDLYSVIQYKFNTLKELLNNGYLKIDGIEYTLREVKEGKVI